MKSEIGIAILMLLALGPGHAQSQVIDPTAYDAELEKRPVLPALDNAAGVKRKHDRALHAIHAYVRRRGVERSRMDQRAAAKEWNALLQRHQHEWSENQRLLAGDRTLRAWAGVLGELSLNLRSLGMKSLADDLAAAAEGDTKPPTVTFCNDKGCTTLRIETSLEKVEREAVPVRAPPSTEQFEGPRKAPDTPTAMETPRPLARDTGPLTLGQRLALLGPDVPVPVVDFLAGYGDATTLGLTPKLRQLLGRSGDVNMGSPAYRTGDLLGWIGPGTGGPKTVYFALRAGKGEYRLLDMGKYASNILKESRRLYKKWKSHKAEFPEFKNALQYVKGMRRFVGKPPKGTEVFRTKNGTTLLYQRKTNTFAAKAPNGTIKTMYRPRNGASYWKIRKTEYDIRDADVVIIGK